jgi:hypothetical protein
MDGLCFDGLFDLRLITKDHRAEWLTEPSQGGFNVVVAQHPVSLDYCSGWNNASEKVIIVGRLSI